MYDKHILDCERRARRWKRRWEARNPLFGDHWFRQAPAHIKEKAIIAKLARRDGQLLGEGLLNVG